MAFNKIKDGYSSKAKIFTSTKAYKSLAFLPLPDVDLAFDFAYEMSFGDKGEH